MKRKSGVEIVKWRYRGNRAGEKVKEKKIKSCRLFWKYMGIDMKLTTFYLLLFLFYRMNHIFNKSNNIWLTFKDKFIFKFILKFILRVYSNETT